MIVLGVMVLAAIGAFISANPLTEAQATEFDDKIVKRRQSLEAEIERCQQPQRRTFELLVKDAEARGQAIQEPFRSQLEEQFLRERSRRECLRQIRPGPQGPLDQRLHFAGVLLFVMEQLTFPIAVIALVLGATLIGAEWSSGAMTPLLTWQPRRLLLFSSKALALGLSLVASFLLVAGLLAISMLPATFVKGTFVGLDRWWLEDALDIAWRGGSIVVLASFLSFSVASVFRSTVVAIGSLFGYLVIVERILTNVTEDLRGWLISNNLLVAIVPEGNNPLIPGRSPEEAITLLTAYVAGFLVISGFLFWRRDVAGSN